MTEVEVAQALALAKCKFSPGSTAKRFVRAMAEAGALPHPGPTLTEKQSAFLNRLAHSYRKQLGACMAVDCQPCKAHHVVTVFCKCGEQATVYRIVEHEDDAGYRLVAKHHGFRREIEISNEQERERDRVGYLLIGFGAHRADEAAAQLATHGFKRWQAKPEERDVAIDALLDAGWERGEALAAFDQLLMGAEIYKAVAPL